MPFEFRINPRKVAYILGAISLFLAIQSLIGEYILENILGSEFDGIMTSLIDLFSVNSEESIPTWYSTLVLFFSAILLAFIAAMKQKDQEPYRYYWVGLAFIFLYLSMDEGAAIHEIFSDPLQVTFNTTGYLAFGWQIAFVPLLLLFVLLYFRFLLHLPPRIRNLFIVAGLLYVGGAVIVEAISANRWYVDGGVSFSYLAIATVEESFEMLGITIFIFALLTYIVAYQYMAVIDFSTFSQPSQSEAARSDAKKPASKKMWAFVGVALLIISLNITLFSWASGQQFEQTPIDPWTMPFYQTVTERYAGQGVVILSINEVLEPDNVNAPQIAASLLTLFNDVMAVTLPASQTSIVFASQTLPFDANVLSEIVSQSSEDEFIILEMSDIQLLASNKSAQP